MVIVSSYYEASCQLRQRARSMFLVAIIRISGEHSKKTAKATLRKEWATVDQYGPNLLGNTRPTMVKTMGSDSERTR
jgi:hypothetical protein